MDVVASIEKTESAFREIDNIIERSGSYWNGNGHTGMQRVHAGKRDDYKKICKMLREHIQSLQQIAGVYEQNRTNCKPGCNIIGGGRNHIEGYV